MDKSLITGSTTTLILKLLEEKDLYGYEMIEALANKSDNTFTLKAGTLYPLLHGLEKNGVVLSKDEQISGGRTRRYYHLTQKGQKLLEEKQAEWNIFYSAVNKVLKGGIQNAVSGTNEGI